MFSTVEIKMAALEVLGEERVNDLAQFPPLLGTNTTTTTLSQDTEDRMQAPDVEEGTA